MQFKTKWIAPSRARKLLDRLYDADPDTVTCLPGGYVWDVSRSCESPNSIILFNDRAVVWDVPGWRRGDVQWTDLPHEEYPGFSDVTWHRRANPEYLRGEHPLVNGPFTVKIVMRCKKCVSCKAMRSYQWQQRALREVADAERTWFVTLTFNESALRAIKRDPEGEERRVIYEGQGFLKRLRRRGFTLRHLTVTEYGEKNGRVHLHALIHSSSKLLKKHLRLAWSGMGFVHAVLVHKGTASQSYRTRYVAKYTTKGAASRVRASLHYGSAEFLQKLK